MGDSSEGVLQSISAPKISKHFSTEKKTSPEVSKGKIPGEKYLVTKY